MWRWRVADFVCGAYLGVTAWYVIVIVTAGMEGLI